MRQVLVLFLLVTSYIGCKDKSNPEPLEDFVGDFYLNAEALTVQVAYEDDAEPFFLHNLKNAWNISELNVDTLLSGREIELSVPKSLDEMTYLGDLSQSSFTNQDLRNLASDVHQFNNTNPNKGVVVLFLDGYFNKDGVVLDRVLGLNISGTHIIAIFKPVVELASNSTQINTLVEQSTVTHEIGHALGLVNNGVELTSAHHDEAHGAHCTNTDCVMYWENGGNNVVGFLQDYAAQNEIYLFGDECISDVTAK